jgi:hypothetical protein
MHVLFAMSGNHPGFLSEFEVALKSVLMNAPLQSRLGIHVMADQQAYDALEEIFDRTEVRTWRARVPITIHTYNVEPKLKEWQARIHKGMHQYGIGTTTGGHTIGTFFRLFANDIVPDDVKHALYMDTDAILMANIEEVWRHLNPDSLFHWGASMCAGFVLLSLDKLDLIWDLVEMLDLKAISRAIRQNPNDQLIFRALNVTYPQNVTILPSEWDVSLADGAWRYKKGHFKKTIVQKRPEMGMMHFNGARASKDAYFETHGFLTDKNLEKTWGIAHYWVRVPWTWARFMAKSQIDGEGYMLDVDHNNS